MHGRRVDSTSSHAEFASSRRGRFRQHLVIERAAESTHLVHRSRQHTPRGRPTFATNQRRSLERDSPPIREPSRPMSSAMVRLQPYQHTAHGISWIFCNSCRFAGSVKISVHHRQSAAPKPRRLSVTHYLGGVGESAQQNRAFHRDKSNPPPGAMRARIPGARIQSRIAFMDMAAAAGVTADRASSSDAMGLSPSPRHCRAHRLSNRVGAAWIPAVRCRRILLCSPARHRAQVLPAGGVVPPPPLPSWERPGLWTRPALKEVTDFGKDAGRVQVKTPDRSMDFPGQRWLFIKP